MERTSDLHLLELECGADGDDHRGCGQSFRRGSVLCDPLLADNTTRATTRYQYVDPPDVTLKNLDLTDKGQFYVSAVSNDTDESGARPRTFTVRLRSRSRPM